MDADFDDLTWRVGMLRGPAQLPVRWKD